MDILERIFARKREDLAANKARLPLKEIQSRLAESPKPRGFVGSLVESKHPVSLIAEVKKASPVKGVIREDFDPKEIANSYRAAGADCLSVLTDVEFFQGDPSYLAICREESGLPVLRKDFTVDEYDVWFSRMLGADAVLLIVSGLDKHQLRDYRQLAESLEMEALVEAHSEAEAETALESGAKLVGINNRDLATFETDLETSERIIPMVAKHATVVSESALRNHEDIVRSAAAGARAVLIGTTFCAAPNIEEKVKEVMGW